MIFPVDQETARWIQKTISRMRCKNDWATLASREACWTPAFLSALIDEADSLVTAGLGQPAYDLSRHLQLLAERIRRDEGPEGELLHRSLVVWSTVVHASSCRLTSRFVECEALFRAAFDRSAAGVLSWARGELARRYGIYLLQRSDLTSFDWADQAIAAFVGNPERLAETLLFRGVAHSYITADNAAAISDFTAAASLLLSLRSNRAQRNLFVAFHNIARQLVADPTQSLSGLGQARKLIQASRRNFGPGISLRKLTSIWVEALLVHRMGWNRHGERLLEKAREGFRKLNFHDEFIMATLDLVLLLHEDGEPKRAIEVLESSAPLIADRCRSAPQVRAGWKPTLDKDDLLRLRGEVQDQLRPTWRQAKNPGYTLSNSN